MYFNKICKISFQIPFILQPVSQASLQLQVAKTANNFLYSLQLLPSYCGCNKYSQNSLADVTHPTVVKYTVELFAVYTQFLYISFANFYSRIRSFEVYNNVFQYHFVTIRMAEWSKASPRDWEVKGSIPVETKASFSKFLPF